MKCETQNVMDTHADTFAHFINHLTVEERYTAPECSFVRSAAAVKSAERTSERYDKMLRFREEEEECTGIHFQVHTYCNLTEIKSSSNLPLFGVPDIN